MNQFEHIDLSIDNVKKIVKYGFEVFSNNHIDKVSTNVIVKKANISRGLLYYHFKDKDELFEFLLYFSLQKSVVEVIENIDIENGDILARLKDIFTYRLDVVKEYPYLYAFAIKHMSVMKEKMTDNHIDSLRRRMYAENIDRRLFLDQDNADKLIKIAKWSFSGILNEFMMVSQHREEDLLKAKNDLEDYYKYLANAFYK